MDEVKRIKSPEYAGAIARICRRYHIYRLGLFGSTVRRELTLESDIDLLVEFEQGHAPALSGLMALQQELTHLFGRKADVATSSILRNPFRRRAIMCELEEIYAD
jgi:predicted nucleotidyltransferase